MPPPSLAAPGRIEHRQTTYWGLRAGGGARFRVHFRDKAEFAYASAEYPRVEIADDHPLLVDHDEPQASLFVSGGATDADAATERLDQMIRSRSRGWRRLASYIDRPISIQELLRAGGLLMKAGRSTCAAAAELLEELGIPTSLLDGRAPRPAASARRVLVLGRSYVVAAAFAFERRLA